jgi:hypothetical protein
MQRNLLQAPGQARLRRANRAISALLAASLLSGCAPPGGRIAPIPLPSSPGDHAEMQGAIFTAVAYTDPKQAESAFGFDARGAGLLPVRISVDNRSNSVIRLNPQQTFLIDYNNQAWPVLTSEQAFNRISKSVELETMALGGVQSAGLLGTAGAISGFALSVILSRGMATPIAQGAAAGASIGAVTGATDALYSMEAKLRQELSSRTLKNQRIQPGDLAYGVMFFPGHDEARSARTLRLNLEIDSYPEVITLPLRPPPPTPRD